VPYWRLFYHLIWATKDRAPVIGEREEQLIRRSFALTFDDLETTPHAIGFMPDHVHVVASAPPKVAPAELVRRLKGASTHAVNFKGDGNSAARFAWQGEYGVLSLGEQALPDVVAYVQDQPSRHANGNIWPKAERAADPD
jgi:putative transposase